MNILLVKPPFARLLQSDAYLTYPLGLMGVAAVLRAAGHDVTIYHDDVSNLDPIPRGHSRLGEVTYSHEQLEKSMGVFTHVLDGIRPDVVGVSYTTSDVVAARMIAAECRNRGIRTVAGGIHPSLCPDDEMEFFDVVVAGEGDHPIVECMFDEKQYNPLNEPYYVLTPSTFSVADRDCVIWGEHYSPYLRGMIQTQRGCPYHCSFCAAPTVFGTKVRTRDPGAVREEVESLGVTSGRIIDDSFGVVKSHSLAVCHELEKVNYSWVCDMAVRDVDEELLDAMVAAGCGQINLGVESASEKWRALSGKHVDAWTVRDAMAIASARGVAVVLYFMIGWPGETSEELGATLAVAQSLKDEGAKPHISIVTPYPGTKLWDMCDVADRGDWSSFMHQSRDMGFADVPPDVWAQALQTATRINGG